MAAKRDETCRVLLLGRSPERTEQIRKVLEESGYQVLDSSSGRRNTSEASVVLVLLDHDEPDQDLISSLTAQREYPPPVVVLGPARGRKWRREALQAGAFACLSDHAPREDQIGIVAAANRYRALQLELQIIRRESDIVMKGLLESFGSEAVKLRSAMTEAERVRESLENFQTRIIRSML